MELKLILASLNLRANYAYLIARRNARAAATASIATWHRLLHHTSAKVLSDGMFCARTFDGVSMPPSVHQRICIVIAIHFHLFLSDHARLYEEMATKLGKDAACATVQNCSIAHRSVQQSMPSPSGEWRRVLAPPRKDQTEPIERGNGQ